LGERQVEDEWNESRTAELQVANKFFKKGSRITEPS
jgi:hypothetical protein